MVYLTELVEDLYKQFVKQSGSSTGINHDVEAVLSASLRRSPATTERTFSPVLRLCNFGYSKFNFHFLVRFIGRCGGFVLRCSGFVRRCGGGIDWRLRRWVRENILSVFDVPDASCRFWLFSIVFGCLGTFSIIFGAAVKVRGYITTPITD